MPFAVSHFKLLRPLAAEPRSSQNQFWQLWKQFRKRKTFPGRSLDISLKSPSSFLQTDAYGTKLVWRWRKVPRVQTTKAAPVPVRQLNVRGRDWFSPFSPQVALRSFHASPGVKGHKASRAFPIRSKSTHPLVFENVKISNFELPRSCSCQKS